MFAAMDDVTGETAETKREFAAEIEKCSEQDEHASEKKQRAAEVAKVHMRSLRGNER